MSKSNGESSIGRGNSVSRREVVSGGGLVAGATALGAFSSAASAEGNSVENLKPLAGQVALVTGAGREIGIGRATALALARAGADVAICDINRDIPTIDYKLSTPEELEETRRLVEAEGQRCLSRTVDVRDRSGLRAFVGETIAQLGRVDIAVPNAGVIGRARADQITDAQWDTVIDVNIHGTMNTIRAVAPNMVERGSGRIIIIGSVSGRRGGPTYSHYNTSKWALIGMAKAVALDLAQSGICVNVVGPGLTRTGMTANPSFFRELVPDVEDPTEEQAIQANLEEARRGNLLPIAWVTPENIAEAVLYLASDGGQFVTGTQFEISHGHAATHTG